MKKRKISFNKFELLAVLILSNFFSCLSASDINIIDEHTSQHQGLSGVGLLDKGEESLFARAWLTNHAKQSIDVQYFIWSNDNIGTLAVEALLRAAERQVKIRVIVDDLMIDAPDKVLLALSLHPNIDIRIYNPLHSVGTSKWQRFVNVINDFRAVNQRMHDKTFIVDQKVVITGGRNMADEYFDFNQRYNFRDRDILVVGKTVNQVNNNFNNFWLSDLTQTVQQRFKGDKQLALMNDFNSDEVQSIYNELHEYALDTSHFEPEVKNVLSTLSDAFPSFIADMVWSDIKFIHDIPGKNNKKNSFHAGGETSAFLASLLKEAKHSIVIQSPYLILSDEARLLFKNAINRGVSITVSTNSLSSTDNLQAFSGYKKQRDDLIAMGIKIFEYKPNPATQLSIMQRYEKIKKKDPVFAIHAKSMVIDGLQTYIGTYNLDPRSQNLNTEVGIIVSDPTFAKKVEDLILIDSDSNNSWSAKDNPDQHASWLKRAKVLFWQLFPMNQIL